ncbi:gliding motility protein GldM [Algivirga pacifica]|uniref:Gliding motility protein GldM n=1 Tax=Algivirga pacifica TaxID=1162670 RepID=A0ABP9DB62_9BACT
MAGGAKETPRQKMINLMYLVLLAMLALQVSDTVLDKFIFINQALTISNNTVEQKTQSIYAAVDKEVAKMEEDQPNEVAKQVRESAKEVKQKTDAVLKQIESIRQGIKTIAGKDETGQIQDKSGSEKMMQLTLGPGDAKSGEAYKLKKQLDAYVKDLNEIAKANVQSNFEVTKQRIPFSDIDVIAKDAKDYPQGTFNKEQLNKDFAILQFQGTPNAAAIAVLTQLEAEVLKAEASVMDVLMKRVKAEPEIDQYKEIVIPQAIYVPKGTNYEAELMVGASSSSLQPRMKANGAAVNVENGVGHLSFKAMAKDSEFDQYGKAEKIWRGVIEYPTGSGWKQLPIERKYYVIRPDVVISEGDGGLPDLYLNCGNTLKIDVPSLGSQYSPKFRVSGGSVSANGKVATILPTSPKGGTLTVYSGDMKIDSKKFRVKRLPAPKVNIYAGREAVVKDSQLEVTTLAKNKARAFTLQLVPDASVKDIKSLKRDLNYGIKSAKVSLVNSDNTVFKSERARNGVVKFNNRDLKAATRVLVEIQEGIRRNFRKQDEVVIKNATFNINLSRN